MADCGSCCWSVVSDCGRNWSLGTFELTKSHLFTAKFWNYRTASTVEFVGDDHGWLCSGQLCDWIWIFQFLRLKCIASQLEILSSRFLSEDLKKHFEPLGHSSFTTHRLESNSSASLIVKTSNGILLGTPTFEPDRLIEITNLLVGRFNYRSVDFDSNLLKSLGDNFPSAEVKSLFQPLKI